MIKLGSKTQNRYVIEMTHCFFPLSLRLRVIFLEKKKCYFDFHNFLTRNCNYLASDIAAHKSDCLTFVANECQEDPPGWFPRDIWDKYTHCVTSNQIGAFFWYRDSHVQKKAAAMLRAHARTTFFLLPLQYLGNLLLTGISYFSWQHSPWVSSCWCLTARRMCSLHFKKFFKWHHG